MNIREKIFTEIARKMGPDFFNGTHPPVFQYDSYSLQRKAKNQKLFDRLSKIYRQIPSVKCGPCGDICCRESPDVYLLEYLYLWRYIRYELKDTVLEANIVRRSMDWAFLRYFKPGVFCPFLVEKKCVVYDARPLNCRLWALEKQDYYEKKAERARRQLNRQSEFYRQNDIDPAGITSQSVLPKCKNISVDENRSYSEEEIVDMDLKVAFLHLTLIPHGAFRSLNFHLHFPGHVAMKMVDPAVFDSYCLKSAREFIDRRESATVQEMAASCKGKLP